MNKNYLGLDDVSPSSRRIISFTSSDVDRYNFWNTFFIITSMIFLSTSVLLLFLYQDSKMNISVPVNVSLIEYNTSINLINSLGVVSNNCSIVPITFFDGSTFVNRSLVDVDCFRSRLIPGLVDDIVNSTNDCMLLSVRSSVNVPRRLVDVDCTNFSVGGIV